MTTSTMGQPDLQPRLRAPSATASSKVSLGVHHPPGVVRPKRVSLMGVKLDAWTEREVVEHILAELDAGRGGTVVTANLDHIRRARLEPEYRQIVEEADVVTPDGTPLVWASKVQRTPLPERVAGSSLVGTLAEAAAEAGRSLYLLGGAPGAAEGAAASLRERLPSLRIVGIDCPAVGFEKSPEALAAIREKLEAAEPDVVYVALGSPKQENLIRTLRDNGVLPGAWWIGVGISLSFLAGEVKRAPPWVQRAGLEWVHRLCQEPGRLFKRYVVHGIPFGVRLMAEAATKRGAGKQASEQLNN